MFQIVWGNGFHVNAYTEEERDTYVQLLTSAGCSGTVYHKKETAPEKHFIVRVKFEGYWKSYMYLSKYLVPIGTTVRVRTEDGTKDVLVVDSGEMTENEINRYYPFKDLKYINDTKKGGKHVRRRSA